MPLSILVLTTATFNTAELEQVRAVAPDATIRHALVRDWRAVPREVWADVDVLYTANPLPEPEWAPRLRWVQLHFAGVEDVIVHPLAHTIRSPMPRACTRPRSPSGRWPRSWRRRRLPLAFELQQKAQWPTDRWGLFVPDELRGATIGIIGYGAMGREIGRLCAALGMHVIGLRRGSGAGAPLARAGSRPRCATCHPRRPASNRSRPWTKCCRCATSSLWPCRSRGPRAV